MGRVKPTICIGGNKAFIWAKRNTALPVVTRKKNIISCALKELQEKRLDAATIKSCSNGQERPTSASSRHKHCDHWTQTSFIFMGSTCSKPGRLGTALPPDLSTNISLINGHSPGLQPSGSSNWTQKAWPGNEPDYQSLNTNVISCSE